ncbi:MAG: Smr/MutS family protein [Planctomycetes bacterium]|nr:Smr/MutS family protein [Planctomycetota bacterium]
MASARHPWPHPEGEVHIDLHGEAPAEVVRRLQDELERAFKAKIRHVVFIHGVGNHSGGASPVASKTREFLRSLEETPDSAVQKLELGERRRDLGLNAGCVRVTLAIQLPQSQVRYTAAPSSKTAKRVDRKLAARLVNPPDHARIDHHVRRAEDELSRRYGKPGLDKPYRPPSPKRGEWPGQGPE